MKRLVILGGPTAAGKTSAAVRLAQRLKAVVVSADAMQVYRDMNVGTGKITTVEMDGVLHFGLDLRAPDEPFDVGDFIEMADAVIAEHERVVVAGGTSMYLHGLLRGIVQTPPVDPAVRSELEGRDDLHASLQKVDPVLASRLHPNDRVRLVRGLEVFLTAGVKLSDLHAEHAARPDRYQAATFWLDQSTLDERINARVHTMVADGYVEEVRSLLADGYSRDLKPMQSLGYRHLCSHLLDGLPVARAIEQTQRDTRRFARKQRTWQNKLKFTRLMDDHSCLFSDGFDAQFLHN